MIKTMKKVVLFCTVVFTIIFASCVKNSSEFKELQARNDSLTLANIQANTEVDQILELLNEVEDNFRSIKSAENYLSVQSSAPGELTPSTRDHIQSDIQFVTETLEKNRQQIASLEKKLKNSNLNSSHLSKTIEILRLELEEKTTSLVAMRDELGKKDQQIAELTTSVTNLSKDVQTLKTQSETQKETIEQQKTEMTTVYYCFGTSSELKKQNIMNGKQLGTNFNHDYFIPIDMNTMTVIPLYAKKGQLISKHPEGSYDFVKDATGQVELHILDPKNFWSLTKYLVVLVNV
jgi:archaellum component FlaC